MKMGLSVIVGVVVGLLTAVNVMAQNYAADFDARVGPAVGV